MFLNGLSWKARAFKNFTSSFKSLQCKCLFEGNFSLDFIMWSFGAESFGEITSLLNKRDTQLTDILKARTFYKAFEGTHLKLLQFLFAHVLDLVDLALGRGVKEGTEEELELKRVAMFCFVTPAGQFTSQLTTCRPFLQRLNGFISGDNVLSNDDITRFCAILDFVVQASNGFVLLHFPDRQNLLRKLMKYVKYVSVYNFVYFLSYSGLQVVTDFLVQVDAMNVLLQSLGQDAFVNGRLFVLMSNVARTAKAKSKLTEPFLKKETVEDLLKYCFDANEKTAVSALRLLTCLCNHFYESGLDAGLIKQIGEHIPEFCDYIKTGEHFTKSRSLALLILIRIVAFTRDLEVDKVLDLLPGLMNRMVNEPACTSVHSAFYELLKVAVTRKPAIVAELKLKEVIMDLYSKRSEMIANYWGYLHRITGLIVRWKVFDNYNVDGWDQFVETVYHREEQIYLTPYGGVLPNNQMAYEDEGQAFPSMSHGSSSGGQKLSKPQFSVRVELPSGHNDSKSESETSEEEDFDYDETEADPPELQGDDIQWMFAKLISKDRIKETVKLGIEGVFVQETPTDMMVFSPNGKIIAIGSGRDVEVYRTDHFQALLLRTCFKNRIAAMAFTQDNSQLVIVPENDPRILYYNINNGSLDRTAAIDACDSAALSSDCTKLACSKGTVTKIYNTETLEVLGQYEHDKKIPIFTVFSGNGNCVATAYVGGHVHGYSLEKKGKLFSLKCHEKEITAVAIGNSGTVFATASVDSTVRLWTIRDRPEWATLKAHRQIVNSLSLDSSEKWLISGSKDMTFNISNMEAREMVYSVHAHIGNVTCVSCDPNHPVFATASEDQMVKIWSLKTI